MAAGKHNWLFSIVDSFRPLVQEDSEFTTLRPTYALAVFNTFFVV